ncbi:DDB1- and CUL4-associated factor homolog 1-like isoform X2 [Lycium ferocissimum]|uniref:DDB1- and CUL4-associated factor homolog 1-like isoform X2 n=1 Tax=Lycium ferocissimum TaxID=112874 RepID=UPI0028164D9D|nr:DDB1- and CUL4-associated factor homolog 1-like isoform X2 [Lycium ferocissimum]
MEIILLEVNRTGCKQNFARAAIKLIGVTDSGRASIIAATDAATPNLRCIKGAALTAATPVTYHARILEVAMVCRLQWCLLNMVFQVIRNSRIRNG